MKHKKILKILLQMLELFDTLEFDDAYFEAYDIIEDKINKLLKRDYKK